MSWIDALERALLLGHQKTVLAVTEAHGAQLRPLLRRMHGIDDKVQVALRADELVELEPNALVLLDADEDDLAWLNANRPLVAQQRLRLVLWWSGSTRAAREQAPDLLSWASKVLTCPSTPPAYALRALEELAEHRPGSIWPRELIGPCLDHLGREALWLSVAAGREALTEALQGRGDAVPVFDEVGDVEQRRALTRLLSELDLRGPSLLVDVPGFRVSEGPNNSRDGWCEIEAPASLLSLAERMADGQRERALVQRLAATLDEEPCAAELARVLLDRGADANELFEALLGCEDPLRLLSERRGGPLPCRLAPSHAWPQLGAGPSLRAAPMASTTEQDAITWIHLSDFHAGQRGEAVWERIDEVFRRSVERMAERLGVPDIFLFTGDLAFSGTAEEYEKVDMLLERIQRWLGTHVPVFAVPGNHDLVRPDKRDRIAQLRYGVLRRYEDEPEGEALRELLWKDEPGFLDPLFAPYSAWAQRSVIEPLEQLGHAVHRSARVPGDLSVVFERNGLRLGLVGLNSSWVQIDGGEYQGKLQLPAEQLMAALPPGDAPLDWLRELDGCLLLTHHPVDWLSKKARKVYEDLVHPPGRFSAALFGHMHEGHTLTESRDGTAARAYVQSPSLFGLERYGRDDESRSMGYAWGRFWGSGELRVWPQTVVPRGGSLVFVDDPSFEPVHDELGGVQLRVARQAKAVVVPAPVRAAETPGLDPVALQRYLDELQRKHRLVRMLGLVNRARIAWTLDDIYIPLDVKIDRVRPGKERLGSDRELLHDRQETLALANVFRRARQLDRAGLVLLGEPGAGKTTTLQQLLLKVARDGSGSIGLPREVYPVWLPLRELSGQLSGRPLRLTDLLCAQLEDPVGTGSVDPEFGRELCKYGKLLLLLDGLDEVADAAEREQVARWIEQLRVHMPDSFIVVSSRLAGYTAEVALGEAFLELELRRLDDDRKREFVHKWYAFVEREYDPDHPEAAKAKAEASADELLELLKRPEYRSSMRVEEMTSNPLLLTAVCLVHRDHGRLPDARAQLYALCIDVLLERWRVNRDRMVLRPEQVRAILQPVAAWMHGETNRVRADREQLRPIVAEALGRLRDVEIDADEFLRLVRDESGILTGFSMDEYGFMHLGLQEFLTAEHWRNEFTAGRRGFEELAARFGDSWWQEVILLLLAEGNPSVFEPFMAALVRRPEFAAWARGALMQQCLAEAAEPSAKPFVDVWKSGEIDIMSRPAVFNLVARRWPNALQDQIPWVDAADVGMVIAMLDTRTGVAFVRIPAGSFLMGSPEDDEWADDYEHPQHEVTLAAFELARTPVTNAQYARYLAANPDAPKPAFWGHRELNQSQQPVVGVSWEEAQAYCEWAGFVLPTEAQWEYAARAGTRTRYWSGDEEADLARVGWFDQNSEDSLHPVAEKPASPFGLFDVHGNVHEWCRDAYTLYDNQPRPGDGLRQEGHASRVVRGGGFASSAPATRSASRNSHPLGSFTADLGFRPARVIP